jgi:hypothetical protein
MRIAWIQGYNSVWGFALCRVSQCDYHIPIRVHIMRRNAKVGLIGQRMPMSTIINLVTTRSPDPFLYRTCLGNYLLVDRLREDFLRGGGSHMYIVTNNTSETNSTVKKKSIRTYPKCSKIMSACVLSRETVIQDYPTPNRTNPGLTLEAH